MKEIKVYVDEKPRKIATQLVDLENEQFNCVMLLFDTDIKPVEVVIDPKLKTHDRELVKEVCEKIIKFINELAWKDVQYDAYQSTIGEFAGSTSAIPRYAKKYFDLWKEMFGEDLNQKE